MKPKFCYILLAFVLSLPAFAQQEKGDSAFQRANYALAAQCYEAAVKEKPTADTYYNLGCAYYRLRKLPEAVVAFQQALHRSPGDTDALHNLAVVNASLPDRFSAPSQMFFSRWMQAWRVTQSPDAWAAWALVMFALFLLFFLAYRAAFRMGLAGSLTKSAFALSALAFVFCVTFNVFAYRQKHDSEMPVAVAVKPLTLRSGPSSTSRALRTLQPGVTLTLADDADTKQSAPLSVVLPDGTTAWVADRTALTIIK